MLARSALFLVVTQSVADPTDVSGQPIGGTGRLSRNVDIYHYTLRNNPEERKYQQLTLWLV